MGWPAANYDGGWFEWSSDENSDRTKGHGDKQMNAAQVKGLIDNNNDGKPYVIIETGWGKAGDGYNNGHVPGAIWVNTDEIEYDCFNARNDWPVDAGDPACWDRSTTLEEDAAKGLGPDDSLPRNWWNLYPDEYLLPAIAYMGVTKNTTVIVYGKSADAAARILWTLMYAGVEDVRFLNGGKNAWTTAGYELETTANTRNSADYFDPDDTARVVAIHPEYKVAIPYVRDVVNGVQANAQLVDIRTMEEYIGAGRPYSYIPTDGRIPGAIWGSDDFTNDDGTLKDPAEIYTLWRTQGITLENHLSFYCGTAWRSSLAWFYAYMMGYTQISNFDSSWFEWSMGDGSAYKGDDPVLNNIVDDRPDLP
jgi:thiosulfate/3-mercaptopyruvate sulfurtransferase